MPEGHFAGHGFRSGTTAFAPMKTAAVFLCLAFAFAGTVAAQEVVAPTNPIELFNGRDFTSWTFCMKNNADPMQTWSVTNGVIHCTGTPVGYLRTKQSYRNYVLTGNGRIEAELASGASQFLRSGLVAQSQRDCVLQPKVVPQSGKLPWELRP
jgi:hypothetical protein